MISDSATREAIRTEKARSVVVEASAGTGKTTLLTDRVKELVEGGISLDELAVVTFTEAAASELRQRIREKLAPEHRRNMDQAWITTIHGFASRVLREYFHLCNGVPEFSMEAAHFSRSELEIQWDLFLAHATPSVLQASSESLRNPGSRTLLEIAGQIEKHRWFTSSAPMGDTHNKLTELTGVWKSQMESLVPLCAYQTDKLLKNIQNTLDSLSRGAFVRVNLQGGSAANWGGKQTLSEVKSKLKDYNNRDLKLMEQYSAMLPVLPALENLVIPFANNMRSLWDSNPTRLSFNDLLHRAWTAVKTSPELQAELNGRFTHIFIDEFQDTSLVQIKLFTELLGKTGLKTKLTVVGDPKQSIFGWRDADIETYKDTLEELKNNNALSETIQVNFRSETTIIDFVNSFGNTLFNQISPEEIPFSCSYSPIEPRQNAGQGTGVTVHRLSGDTAGEIAEFEAAAIADIIQNPGSTAVVFRTKTHLDALVQELDRRSIPYQVEVGRDFHERQEVKDTASLLRAVLCPSDTYALAEAFRSIYFGISDRDISQWRRSSKPRSVQNAEVIIERLREVARFLPPGPFMETLFWNTSLLPAVRDSGYQVTRRLGNLRFILETARAVPDYPLLLETLLGMAPVSADEPSAPPEGGTGAVTLTTIHSAKGLAWKHVILANPGCSFNNRFPSVLVNDRDLTAGVKTADGATVLYHHLKLREKARSRAEYRRLMYVAVTRPRDRLDIFVPDNPAANSPAEILCNALVGSENFYREVTVSGHSRNRKGKAMKILPDTAQKPDEFVYLYPNSTPEVQEEREKQMRLGTEVHRVLELIDFDEPRNWMENNRERINRSLEFPGEASALALNFFSAFDMTGAEVIGREHPLLKDGRQYYIDLLVERNGVLEVIDYKTDRGDPLARAQEYRDKLLLYRNTLEKITGTTTVAKLVFLRSGVVVTV
jgi:ATP-dependent helicase/nuclease subunit A